MIITIGRKPFLSSVCDNTRENRCGGINVDACRIICGNETFNEKLAYVPSYNNKVYGKGMGGGAWENINGRFPANLILQHTSACVLVGTKKVKVPKHRNPSTVKSLFCHTNHEKLVQPDRAFSDFSGEDGCETVEDWRCLIGCPKTLLDNQSGMIASRYFKVIKW